MTEVAVLICNLNLLFRKVVHQIVASLGYLASYCLFSFNVLLFICVAKINKLKPINDFFI